MCRRGSLAPNGTPAGAETTGLHERRHVTSTATETELTGKEGNKLEERLTSEAAEYRNNYGRRAGEWPALLPVLQELGAPQVATLTALSRSAVYEVLLGTDPHPDNQQLYRQIALAYAQHRLQTWGVATPQDGAATLRRYHTERAARGEDVPRCQWCGEPLREGSRIHARFCSDRCRQAANRAQPRASAQREL